MKLTGYAVAVVGLIACSGCPSPQNSAPPPPPAGQSALPDLPPDPRGLKPGFAATPGPRSPLGAIGHSPLPSKPVDGSALNRYFPKDAGEDDVTFTQEKRGTSMAQLSRRGKAVAQLSITDAAENPPLREKYQTATDTVAGYPSAGASEQETAVLVADRYQVKVRSKDASFTRADRAALISRFDLPGLASLK